MVNGVVSLRCPACSRPFLSLPQQQGAMITCPHCACSAPGESYTAASGVGGHTVTSLPIQRRVLQPRLSPMPPPVASVGPAMPVAAPGQGPVWPPAPEHRPLYMPQPPSAFPPAPAVQPGWQPLMPSGQSPFGSGPSYFSSANEADVPAGYPFTSAHAVLPRMEYPAVQGPLGGGFQEPESMAGSLWQPQRKARNIPLALFLLLVLSFAGWVIWWQAGAPMAVEYAAPRAESPVLGPVGEEQPVNESSATVPQKQESVVQKPEVPVMEAEVRRAIPMDDKLAFAPARADELDLVTANADAERLLKTLFKAENFVARKAVISEAEEQEVDIEGFFTRTRPKLKAIKLAAMIPRTLPGQKEMPLFQLLTDVNPDTGALLLLMPQADGGYLLDWPLFAETHERKLARFLQQASGEPAWFHVVLRRSHALALPAEVREGHLCFSLFSSAEDLEECLAIVAAETPLARFFDRETSWGNAYAARLLLQHRPGPEGKKKLVILDCEGAVKAMVFPSGEVKR
jgi:hypothetical protein